MIVLDADMLMSADASGGYLVQAMRKESTYERNCGKMNPGDHQKRRNPL